MKNFLWIAKCSLLGGSFLASTPSFGVQETMPEPFPADRYDKMMQRSPFSVATAAAPVAPDAPNFGMNLYVAGITKLRFEDGSEKDRVTIKTRGDLSSGFTLIGNETNSEGYSVTSVQSAENWKETKVVLKKGGEFSTLTFDLQSTPSTPNAGQNGVPRPPMPVQARMAVPNNSGMLNGGGRVVPPAFQPKNTIKAIPSPIQRPAGLPLPNSQPQGAVNPSMAPGSGNPQDASHRRVRQINVKP